MPHASTWLRREPPQLGGPPPDAVEVWRLRWDDAEVAPDPCLAPEELARAAGFLRDEPRREFLRTRAALRRLLAGYLGIAPERVAFAVGPAGKPRLAGTADLRFNVSHTRGVALLAFARGFEIGVDIERHGPPRDRAGLAERYFAAEEAAALAALPAEQRGEGFYNCWTRKEAFVKALGAGVAFGLDRFAVTLAPGEPAALRWVEGDPAAAACWSLRQLEVGPGASAALAAAHPAPRLACFEA